MRLNVNIPYAVLLFSSIAFTTSTTTNKTKTTKTEISTKTVHEETTDKRTTKDVDSDKNVKFYIDNIDNNRTISITSESLNNKNVKNGNSNPNVKVKRDNRHRNQTNGHLKSLLQWGINIEDQPLQAGDEDEGHEIKQRDIDDAVDAGLKIMHDLYDVKEPVLYQMGLFLDESEAAGRVASFSKPNIRALHQARYGYAAIQASLRLREKYRESRSRRNPENISFLRTDAFDDQCPIRGVPRCPPAARRYRTADGTCNNFEFPWKGASMLPMQRFLLPEYEDDVQSVRRSVVNGARLPSPREVSLRIHRDRDIEMPSVTMMFVQWGQFVDHDITSTAQSRAFNASIPRCCARGGAGFLPLEFMHPECLPIEVPEEDWFLGRLGIRCIEFVRSAPSSRINCDLGWREQINQVTSYIDASTVYGSDSERADSLRIFRNGLLQYGRSRRSAQNPPDPPGEELCRLGALSTECFRGGDTRVGEQPGLTAFHTVWLRYHNRVAAILGNMNAHWSDEKIYQETRRIIAALIQHITFKEFLPIVLGHEVMDLFDLNVERKGFFKGYDARVNPAPANAFSSAAFRFGHSLVQHSFLRSDSKHRLLVNNVTIHEELDNHENIWSFGSVDRLILGFCNQPSQRRDEFISRELTHHLFQQPGQPFGMDLAAVNIQRGRDHGIPGYTAWREPCGLSPIRTWSNLEPLMNFETIQRFRAMYDHVDDIDLYPGGLAERPIRGGIVGPTFGCIIAQQFANLRKGDRFWYENGGFENSFTPAQLQQIRRVTFGQVLCQVLPEIESVQPFVFLSPDNFRNVRLPCDSPDMESIDLRPWEERRLAQSQIAKKPAQPQFPPPPVLPVSLQPIPVQTANNNPIQGVNVGVNGKLDEFGVKVEFINNDDRMPTGRPHTHLSQKVDSKLDFNDGIKVNDKLTKPDKLEINDNLDFSNSNTTNKSVNKNKKDKDKLQLKPQPIDFPNENKHTISDKLTEMTTKKTPTDIVDFDVIFLSGTNTETHRKNHKEREDVEFDQVFDMTIMTSNKSEGTKIIKRDTSREHDQDDHDEYPDDFLEQSSDIDSGRKQSNKKRRKKPTKIRVTTTKPTTKRYTAYIQNRPVTSDFYNPLKIKVTNITTSTVDLGPENDSGRPTFSHKPQIQPSFSQNDEKTKPLTYYQTTRRPLTYDQNEYYVLHPTINKPNRHNAPTYGNVVRVQATTEKSKSPDYQVNINIHLVSSTPKTDIVISDKISNPNVHVVDGSYVNYEQIKPSTNSHYQYSTKRPLTIIPIRTTTERPDYYRPRPTLTPTLQSYYYRPTTYNYDRFDDRPFSTSKRPYIYRPSESFVSMFEEMHQTVTKRPTYITSYVDKVTKRPTLPSYLYYNDGKYFNAHEHGHGQQGQYVQEHGLPFLQSGSDPFYIRHTLHEPDLIDSSTDHKGDKNFVKISSVLGNSFLPNANKEQYIHTAQQKEGEFDLESVENVTNTNLSDVILETTTDETTNTDITNNNYKAAAGDRDVEKVENVDEDNDKIQIDIIPRESRQDDWVIYESVEGIAVMDEPEIKQYGEHVADELPKPLSEFWKKHDETDDDATNHSDNTDKNDNLEILNTRTL